MLNLKIKSSRSEIVASEVLKKGERYYRNNRTAFKLKNERERKKNKDIAGISELISKIVKPNAHKITHK